MDPNKLANVKRDIIKNKRLTDVGLHTIRKKVKDRLNVRTQNSENEEPENSEMNMIQK